MNAIDHTHYFTGRSDNFDPARNSANPNNARLDAESIRVSNDRRHVYISDEYGPYVYEFDRLTGERTRVVHAAGQVRVANLSAHGRRRDQRTTRPDVSTNKGMEGLAITPDGKTLVGAMQSPLIQDGGDVKGGVTRIVTIDIQHGRDARVRVSARQRRRRRRSATFWPSTITSSWWTNATAKAGRMRLGSKAGFKKLFIDRPAVRARRERHRPA